MGRSDTSGAPALVSLTPGHVSGGIDLLKSMAHCEMPAGTPDPGRLSEDLPYIQSALAAATCAAIRSEWERMGCWEHFECPQKVFHERESPAEMRTLIEAAIQEKQEKQPPATAKGRGRGKAKGPSKTYADALRYALSILDTVTGHKLKELQDRRKAYAAVRERGDCTCWWSSSPAVLCATCEERGAPSVVDHSVVIPKNDKGELGLRFAGDWALVLTGIPAGSPAADIPQLERFLEHIVSHVNGRLVAGKADILNKIKQAGKEVTLTFYPRYMNITDSKRQYRQQLLAGRKPALPVGPTEDELRQARASQYRKQSASPSPQPSTVVGVGGAARQVVSAKTCLVEPSGLRVVEESKIAAVLRRYHGARGQPVFLENLCASRGSMPWPAMFRVVTEAARREALLEAGAMDDAAAAKTYPADGVFERSDICAFYPSLLGNARLGGDIVLPRDSTKRGGNNDNSPSRNIDPNIILTENLWRALRMIRNFIETHAAEKIDIFNVVVDEARHGAPSYYTIVTQPSDLYTISTRIRNGLYSTLEEVKADVDLMWQNCVRYNPEPHWLYPICAKLRADFDEEWGKVAFRPIPGGGGNSPVGGRHGSPNPRGSLFRVAAPQADSKGAGRLRRALVALPAYHEVYPALVEKIGEENYEILAMSVAGRPELLDIVVALDTAKLTEPRFREVADVIEATKSKEPHAKRTRYA